jgi:glutamyl-tRNA reductase
VRDHLATRRTAEVTPTVAALRRRAAEVVDAELAECGAGETYAAALRELFALDPQTPAAITATACTGTQDCAGDRPGTTPAARTVIVPVSRRWVTCRRG